MMEPRLKGLSLPRSLSPRSKSPSSSLNSSVERLNVGAVSAAAPRKVYFRPAHAGVAKTASLPIESADCFDRRRGPEGSEEDVRESEDRFDSFEGSDEGSPGFRGSKIATFFPNVVVQGNNSLPVAYF